MLKALTLDNPWALLMALNLKRIETRGWPTRYRGELAIHAGKRSDLDAISRFARRIIEATPQGEPLPSMEEGHILCVVNLFDCQSAQAMFPEDDELLFGDFSPGRYGWMMKDVRRLATPVPCRGRQRIWNVPPEIEAKVRAQL